MDHGPAISYLALEPGAEVFASDGERLGVVKHVLVAQDKDIFDGIVIDVRTGPGGARFVDAPEVSEIYERAVVIALTAAEAENLPKPGPAPAVMKPGAPQSGLQQKLHRAWDLISGNY